MSLVEMESQIAAFFHQHIPSPWIQVTLQVSGDEGCMGYSGSVILPSGATRFLLEGVPEKQTESLRELFDRWLAASQTERFGPFYCCDFVLTAAGPPKCRYYWDQEPLTSIEMVAKDVHGYFHLSPFKHQLPIAVLREYPEKEANQLCDVIDVYSGHQLGRGAAIPHMHLMLFAVGDLRADVDNGGFNQYYGRRVGYGHAELPRSKLYLLVDEGLATFGAAAMRDLFRESIAIYAHYYDEVEAARIALRIPAVAKQEQSDILDRYYDAEGPLRKQLSAYVRANAEKFATPTP